MEDYGAPGEYGMMQPPPVPRQRGRRWLVIGGVAVALALALAVGLMLGSVLHPTAQAANLASNNSAQSAFNNGPYNFNGPSNNDGPQYPMAGTPGAQGGCQMVTVTKVSGSTITGTAPDGSTVTIHTTSSTKYTKAGAASTASAVTAGSHISVMGTHNSDGSITATQIDVH